MSESNNDNEVTLKPQRIENLPLATVSLVFGILSFIMIPFCGLVSLITGIIAYVKIDYSKGALQGKGQAITGIILGVWSVIRIPLVILLAMLLPAFGKAREKAREIECTTNLKMIATGTLQFADDHNNKFPASMEELKNYLDEELNCPMDPTSKYVFLPSAKGIELSKLENPATTPVVICNKHPNKEIILYADGHVEIKRTNDAP